MERYTRKFKLLIKEGYSEKEFVKEYGQELLNSLKNEAFIIDKGRCCACEHEPPTERKSECLFFHITEVNKDNPQLTKGVTLCKMCHLTQHISYAVKSKWVLFVNSVYDQNSIISITRNANNLQKEMNNRTIVNLKKSPESFLEEWQSGKSKPSLTIKVIFSENYTVDDLY